MANDRVTGQSGTMGDVVKVPSLAMQPNWIAPDEAGSLSRLSDNRPFGVLRISASPDQEYLNSRLRSAVDGQLALVIVMVSHVPSAVNVPCSTSATAPVEVKHTSAPWKSEPEKVTPGPHVPEESGEYQVPCKRSDGVGLSQPTRPKTPRSASVFMSAKGHLPGGSAQAARMFRESRG